MAALADIAVTAERHLAAVDGGPATEFGGLAEERARLVRLCARLTGDLDAAEDLAQETLYEAWRNAHKLRDPAGRPQWLGAIARNVCLRWARRRGRELARRAAPPPRTEDAAHPALEDRVADTFDLEVELERHELVRLLDRAMALLPPDTRRVLVESYVEESPQAETALRLGLSEGAVAMRLQRGRLALRRLLTTEFRDEAVAHGLVDAAAEVWQETRIWCSACGARRLLGRFSPSRSDIWLRCPGCGSYNHSGQSPTTGLVWSDVKGFRPTLSRLMAWTNRRYAQALATRAVPCGACGRPMRYWLHPTKPDDPLAVEIRSRCDGCRSSSQCASSWLALCTPEGRAFYREHPRLRYAGRRAVEVGPAGGPAVITSFESVDRAARLDVASAPETLQVLAVSGAPRQ